jgi:hypothetical protein
MTRGQFQPQSVAFETLHMLISKRKLAKRLAGLHFLTNTTAAHVCAGVWATLVRGLLVYPFAA